MVEEHEAAKNAVRTQVQELFRSMSQLATRVQRTERALNRLNRSVVLVEWTQDETRLCNNKRSYLSADLEMSRQMYARLEGVFDRLLALLDANEAEAYSLHVPRLF